MSWSSSTRRMLGMELITRHAFAGEFSRAKDSNMSTWWSWHART
jgi:hypothetical protein